MLCLVPEFILQQHTAGETSGYFNATAIFVDVSGFSTVTDALMSHGQHGAEVLAGIMRRVFDPLVNVIHAYDGFITGFAGDAFTAVIPDGPEDATRRALATIWALQEEAKAVGLHHTPYGRFTMAVKVGAASGQVGWGIVTSEDGRHATYYFQGNSIDGCAAAEKHAAGGESILDVSFYQLVKEWVEVEPVGEYQRIAGVTASLPSPQPVSPPSIDPALMARYFPPAVTVSGEVGEFRQVANLFVSLPTVRTAAQLEIFMRSVFALIDRYGGLLSRLDFGDKGANLLLFWGAPVAHENDIERALNFVLDLQAQTSIPINAGITYRIAHAGYVGGSWRGEYTCNGQGVNLAARFMTTAPRGEIWLDENVGRRASKHFEIDYEGEQTFKGFAAPQKVYVLLERKEEGEAFYDGPLVGRQQELARLTDFVQPLWQGQAAGTMLIWGEPGIGKSRLVHAFHAGQLFEQHETLWATCQTDEIVRMPLNPFRQWLKRYFVVSDLQIDARNKRSFNRQLDRLIAATDSPHLAQELDRTRSLLGALVGLRWPDSLYEQLDAEGRHENTFIGLTVLLRAESLQQPVVLFIEDTQWLDEDSRAFLPRLVRALTADDQASYPLAILATSRPEPGSPPLGETSIGAELNLEGLPHEDLAQMAADLLEGPATTELLELVAQRAEGNPFFAEQVIRYLQESDLLAQSEAGWTVLEVTPDRPPLPTDVQVMLVARLDRLAYELRRLVQTAAVLGREFEVRLLGQMLGAPHELKQQVTQVEQADIWAAMSEIRYLFKHTLLRDAAYRMQLRAQRQSLHALAVTAMETLYAADLSPHYGELAYHAEAAGLADKARQYLQLAGQTAKADYHNEKAADYFGRALALTAEGELAARYQLLLQRESVYSLMGDRQAQHQDLQALQALALAAADVGKQAEVAVLFANYLSEIGKYSEAAQYATRAITLAEAANWNEGMVRAHSAAVHAFYRQSDYALAERHGQAALALAQKQRLILEEGRIRNQFGLIALEHKDLSTARHFFAESLLIMLEEGDKRGQSAPLNNLGLIYGYEGDYDNSRTCYERSLALSREIGDRYGEAINLANLGYIAGNLGDYAMARVYVEQATRLSREIESRVPELYGLLNLSSWAGVMGESVAALEYAETALKLARLIGERSGEAWALTYQGHSLLAQDRPAAAKAAYEASLDLRRALDQPVLATEPEAGLARVALALNDIPTAQGHVATIMTHLESGGSLDGTDDPLRIYLTSYQVLKAANNKDALSTLEKASQILFSRADNIKDEGQRQQFLQKNPVHRQILLALKEQGKAVPG